MEYRLERTRVILHWVIWDTSKANDGFHTLTAIATDTSENVGTPAVVNVAVSNEGRDATLPSVTIGTPSGGATVSGGSVLVSAKARDNVAVASVQFIVDGLVLGTDTTAPYSIQWDTTTAIDGFHDLSAVAIDTSQNAATATVVSVFVSNESGDTTPPGVELRAPDNGATVAGALVLIRAVARDDVSLASVQFLVDGVTIETDTTAPYSILWNTSGVADGLHNLIALAIDSSGNSAISNPVIVSVENEGGGGSDTTAPTVAIGTPAGGATVSGDAVLIDATAKDDVGVASVRFLVDGVLIDTDTSTPYSTQWDTTEVTNGVHQLIAVAVDTSANEGTPAVVSVIVSNEGLDKTAPTVAIGTPANDATVSGDAVLIGVTAEDDVGVDRVRFVVDGVLIGTDTSFPYSMQCDTTDVTNGLHELSVVVTDSSGNTFISDAVIVRVSNGGGVADTTAPTVTIGTPVSGATVTGNSVPIGATAKDDVGVASVGFLVDGVLIGTDTSFPYSMQWDTTGVTNGLHELSVVATDLSGNMLISDPVIVRVSNRSGDTTGPTVTIDTPVSGATVTGNSVPIGATAKDDVGVASVGFLVDAVLIDTDTSTPYSTQWDTTEVTNGLHELTVVATDLSGNTLISDPVIVRVSNSGGDTTGPAVTIDTPASDATVSGDSVLIGVTAEDDVGVASVEFRVDGTLIGTDTSFPYFVEWDARKVTNGLHELTVVATDLSGNVGVATVTVNVSNAGVDTTAPTVSIDSPADGATVSGSSVTISATAKDDVGVASVEFSVDGTLIGTDTSFPFSIQWDTTTTSNGTHTVIAEATDLSDNDGVATVTVTVSNDGVDTTAPTVSIDTPAGGATVSGDSLTIGVTATDDVGVASVEFRVDGALIGTDTSFPYFVQWDTTAASNGTHTLSAEATDLSGNKATSATVTVTVSNVSVDTTAPTVSIVTPASGPTVSGDSVPIGATATDDVGVASVRFLVDGALLGTDTSAPYFVQWDTTTASDGTHTVSAEATDLSGNLGGGATVTVTVSN